MRPPGVCALLSRDWTDVTYLSSIRCPVATLWPAYRPLAACRPPKEVRPVPTGPGDILDLIRHGRASTRGDVLEATGLSRMTVAQRLDALLGAAMIVEGDTTEATGGRRRRSLTFNTS